MSKVQKSLTPATSGPSGIPTGPRSMASNTMIQSTQTAWLRQSELCLTIDKMPLSMTAREIWNLFKEYGVISSITLFEDDRGNTNGRGQIFFSPPPKKPFWNKPIEIYREKKLWRLILKVKPLPQRALPGLINTAHRYPPTVLAEFVYLTFGVLLKPDKMLICRDTSSFPSWGDSKSTAYRNCPLTITHKLEHRELQITFPLHFQKKINDEDDGVNRTEIYRLTIPLQQHVRVCKTHMSPRSNSVILVISIEAPPKCERRGDELQTLEHNPHKWNVNESLYRQVDIVLDPRKDWYKQKPASLRQDHSVINIGRWTCYALEFKNALISPQFKQLCDCLRDHNISIQDCPEFGFTRESPPQVWTYIDQPGMFGFDTNMTYSLGLLLDMVPLSFPVRYQLEVCISGGWLSEYGITREFVEKLHTMPPMRACALLEFVASDKPDQGFRRIFEPMSIFRSIPPASSLLVKKRPAWCSMIRSAVVTPSTIIVNTPVCEMSNRVIRHYSEHADRFLRVRFLDERHQGRIYSAVGKNTMNEVFTRVFRAMNNGIVVGGQRYEFLAFGNSQFRENGAYFFCPTATLDASKIRQWMGDFSHIKVVAKYAARLGQCFSTTRAMKSVKPRIREIRDVERNGFVFTDGVGKMSSNLAEIASNDFRIPKVGGNPPSVFQFRLGGAKGILAVWSDVRGLDLCIRDSQNKFKTTKEDLEIIKWAQASEFSLNRQLIMVLSTLGVPDEVFRGKMKEQLRRLDLAMKDENVAMKTLNSSIDINGTTMILSRMVSDGFHWAKEPFMITILNLWRAWSIKYLKEKARVHVPKGAVLLGCSDETQTLAGHYDHLQPKLRHPDIEERVKALPEVFVQISNFEGRGHSKIVKGIMIIARNPSLHAGDVRVVRGVDVEALHHLRDCLVLPQTGDRDVAGMCSGGDLDGDDYIVCWDEDLIPFEWNHEAMDFTPPRPIEKSEGVSVEDIQGFFVQYMKNADLGNIAYSHLASADFEAQGVKSEKCVKLAQIHSNAVDYPKSGQAAYIPDSLRPRNWPHFMERKSRTYTSRKILGQLYDSVTLVDFNPAYDNAFDNRILNFCECNEDTLETAREIKRQYDTAVRRIMAQYGVLTEFEVWSTFTLERNRNHGDFKFSEMLGESVSTMKEQYCEICIEKAGSRDPNDLGPFVVAMYTVTNQEMQSALQECQSAEYDGEGFLLRGARSKTPQHMPLMSFPWLFPAVLGRIARKSGIEPVSAEILDSEATSTQPVPVDRPSIIEPSATTKSPRTLEPLPFSTQPVKPIRAIPQIISPESDPEIRLPPNLLNVTDDLTWPDEELLLVPADDVYNAQGWSPLQLDANSETVSRGTSRSETSLSKTLSNEYPSVRASPKLLREQPADEDGDADHTIVAMNTEATTVDELAEMFEE